MKKFRKTVLLLSFLTALPLTVQAGAKPIIKYVKGKVVDVYREVPEGHAGIQPVKVKIASGKFKEVILKIDNYLWEEEGYNTLVRTGQTVILKVVERKGAPPETQIMGYYRSPFLYLAGLIFVLLFLAIAGVKKIGVLGTIVLNIAVVLALIPVLKRGYPPVLATLILGGAGIALTVAVILGRGKKFTASVSGALAGLITAGVVTAVFMDLMHLSGMFSWDSRMLLVACRHLEGWNLWDLKGLVSAGVMVACLGAVVDIAVSIASSCWQIASSAERISASSLWASGMEVGRDITATMINSLMLVFIGVSLPVIAVFEVLGIPFIKVINYEFFSVLILSALAANISLVVTVPVSVFVSSRLFKKP